MQYKIKAHPTMYNGVQYRSRLEARWAAFFDLIDWQHEYEPIDLAGWSPDFVLYGKDGQTLVEVKPVYEFPQDVACKINAALPVEDGRQEVLILGVAPFHCDNYQHYMAGWLRDVNGCWDRAPFVDLDGLGFCHETQSFCCRITGAYDGNWGRSERVKSIVECNWKQAGNITQWRPK